MQENHVQNIDLSNAEDIIREYDSSGTGYLQFEEFVNMILPATN